jgi:DNA-binding CsgD family transcriptional regulator
MRFHSHFSEGDACSAARVDGVSPARRASRAAADIPMHELYRLSLSDQEWRAAATRLLLPAIGGDGPGRWSALSTFVDGVIVPIALDASDGLGERMAVDFPLVAARDLTARMARAVLTNVTAADLWTDATRQFFAELRSKNAIALSCQDEDGGLIIGRIAGANGVKGARPKVNVARAYAVARAVRVAYRARRMAHALGGRDFAPAVLTPDGAVVARDAAAVPDSSLAVLRTAVRARERARRRPNSAGAVAALWSHLVAGRWSLVDDYEDQGRRYVLVVKSGAGERQRNRLTPRQARALDLALQGRSVKDLSDELHASASTVYADLDRAVAKLGVRSVADVAGVARALPQTILTRFKCGEDSLVAIGFPLGVAEAHARLTDAEHAILPLLLASTAHAEIARRRNTSPRTVANQIASIYRKFKVSSRIDLAVRISGR